MKPTRRLARGFTLVELLIVVALIGVLAALAAPALTKMLERGRLRGAAEGVFNDLQLARTEAIKRNAEVWVSFSTATPTNWCYGLRVASACTCTITDPADGAACQLDGVLRVARGSDYRGVSLSQNFTNSRTEFEPRQGLADIVGTATATIGADQVRIVVSSLGRVRACTPTGMPGFVAC